MEATEFLLVADTADELTAALDRFGYYSANAT